MKDWLIIDGYNLLYRISAQNQIDIPNTRQGLVNRLEPLLGVVAKMITIVFDGKQKNDADEIKDSEIIEVVYSPPDKTADSVIQNLVWKEQEIKNILVVTSDRAVRDAVSACGADTMASVLFIEMIAEAAARLNSRLKSLGRQNKTTTLADFFPEIHPFDKS